MKKIGIFEVAYKNLLRKKTRSLLTVLGIAMAAWVLVSLFGFNHGYEASLNKDIDNLGFQMLVVAKGCPYEAATLMLKGGTGLKYMNEEIAAVVAAEPEVEGVTPMLMQVVFDPNKGESGGSAAFLGVDPVHLPEAEERPALQGRRLVQGARGRRGRLRLRSGRARAARGRRPLPHPREGGRGQGRRHPRADRAPRTTARSSCPSGPSRTSSASRS